jgi:hypothetical protein
MLFISALEVSWDAEQREVHSYRAAARSPIYVGSFHNRIDTTDKMHPFKDQPTWIVGWLSRHYVAVDVIAVVARLG